MDNNVLGTGLTFAQLIISAIVFFGGLIAFKVTLNFDLNKYLDSRQEKYKAKCQNACLHFEFIKGEGNQIGVQSFFVSPSGTLSYICQKCTATRLHFDEAAFQRQIEYYSENIQLYNKQNKKFVKLLKKAGQA